MTLVGAACFPPSSWVDGRGVVDRLMHAHTPAAPLTLNSAQHQRLDGSEVSIRRQVEFFDGLLVHLEGRNIPCVIDCRHPSVAAFSLVGSGGGGAHEALRLNHSHSLIF